MNKYLEKVAEQVDSERHTGLAAGLVGGSSLYAKSRYDNGHLDGKTTLYHGTSDGRAEQILKEGLIPKKKAGPAGALHPALDEVEKGLSFTTPYKTYAQVYANMSHDIDAGALHGGVGRGELGSYFRLGNRRGKVLKARVPLSEYDIVTNPAFDDTLTNRMEKVFKGGVDAKHFVENEHYQPSTLKDFVEHAKANPRGVAKSLLIPAAGLGLAYKTYARDKT